jgi:hypothetical protein
MGLHAGIGALLRRSAYGRRHLGATPPLKGQDAGRPGRAATEGATRAEAISGRAAHRNDRAERAHAVESPLMPIPG